VEEERDREKVGKKLGKRWVMIEEDLLKVCIDVIIIFVLA